MPNRVVPARNIDADIDIVPRWLLVLAAVVVVVTIAVVAVLAPASKSHKLDS